MGKFKKPKIWPIVEEINDEIHVIDCLGSREVLNSDTGCCEEVRIPTDGKFHMRSCLVVGYKLYAASMEGGFLVINSKRNRWHVNSSRTQWDQDQGYMCRLPLIRDVWDILEKVRVVRCVGRFPYGNVRDPLYAVIALEDFDKDFHSAHALAFLVASSGQVFCFQRLTRRFFLRPLLFRRMSKGTVIEVEEDNWEKTRQRAPLLWVAHGKTAVIQVMF